MLYVKPFGDEFVTVGELVPRPVVIVMVGRLAEPSDVKLIVAKKIFHF